MNHYDTLQVCIKNGHLINDCYHQSPSHNQKHCSVCGCSTTIKCNLCNTEIRGYYHVDGILDLTSHKTVVPLHCLNCGKPYPWKNILLAKNTFKLLISPVKYLIDSIVGIFKK